MKNQEVKVSIWCTTYNHIKYIRDAIEGFLAQITDFQYEIIIFDDASTDGTREVVLEYQRKYPDLIKAELPEENQWEETIKDLKKRKQRYLKISKGRYIALCEGDDCWIDPHKLQIQVDYMEKHPDCVLALHAGVWLNCQDGSVKVIKKADRECDLSAEDIIMQYGGNPPTASMVVRRNIYEGLDGYYTRVGGVGDYPLQLYALTKGKIHYINRTMSLYRYLTEGSFNSKLTNDLKGICVFYLWIIEFLQKYKKDVNAKDEKIVACKMQCYIQNFMGYFAHHTYDDFMKFCTDLDIENAQQFHDTLELMKRIYRNFYDENYLSQDIREFCEKYEGIYIWGIGNFARKLARQLTANQMNFEGFVVSDSERVPDNVMDRPVRKIHQISNMERTGILLAVRGFYWMEIEQTISRYGIGGKVMNAFYFEIL